MKPTIKPPKGYRMLRDGEVIRATDLVYTFPYQSSDGIKSVFKWQKLDRFDEHFIGKKEDARQSYLHARRITTPTPAEALRWLGKQRFPRFEHRHFGWDFYVKISNQWLITSGKSPLACIRKAMAAEKRGSK